ncbi:MAG: hypothetical protein LBE32_00320 [Burkholderiales bacterium]|jgi:hypothetical protein|nr:hypothetical protein [Burkholderiales bacterium]
MNDTTTDDQLLALHGAFNCLLKTLHESGKLDKDRLYRHLCGNANFLEENGLPEAAAVLDEMRGHLDVLLPTR